MIPISEKANMPEAHKALLMCRRGLAALEFALAAPLLLVILGGAADFGLAEYNKSNLSFALEAGAEYAHLTGSTVTVANIKSVVTGAMNLSGGQSSNVQITTTPSGGPGYYCVTVSGGTPSLAASSSGATCSDGTPAGLYIKIQATYTGGGLLGGFSIPSSLPITDTVTVRIQ